MSFTPINTHVQDAEARLLSQYQDAPLINGFIEAIVSPVQDIEAVLANMNGLRSLSGGSGQQLDNLGRIVGIDRVSGQTDAQYLLSIYGQIGVNRSTGLAEDVIAAFLVYTGATDCEIWEFYPAAFSIVSSYVFESSDAMTKATTFIQSVAAVGINFIGFLSVAPTIEFMFDGPQVGYKGAGFGDVNDASVGGFWSETIPD